MRVIARGPEILETWDPAPRVLGVGAPLNHEFTTLPAYRSSLIADSQIILTYGGPPENKSGTSRPAFQSHSRSTKVTWIDRVLPSSDPQ